MNEENENESIQMAFHFCLNEFLQYDMLFSKIIRYILIVLETIPRASIVLH